MPAQTISGLRAEITRSDTRPVNWPVEFCVCAFHKENCFPDYKNAILDETKPCILCEPCENDSLGG